MAPGGIASASLYTKCSLWNKISDYELKDLSLIILNILDNALKYHI